MAPKKPPTLQHVCLAILFALVCAYQARAMLYYFPEMFHHQAVGWPFIPSYTAGQPHAAFVLPNGLVKLINALPFVCGDLRKQSLTEVWSNFQRAWSDPRVAQFVDELAADPHRTSTLHQWIHL